TTSLGVRKRRKATASRTIITGPPTNSASVDSQPRISAITMPSSITRLVDANWKTIAAGKSAPLRNSDPADATEGAEPGDDGAPTPGARARGGGEPSGSSRRTACFVTTAGRAADRAKPRIRAQRISQNMPNANESASTPEPASVGSIIPETYTRPGR